MVLTAEQDRPFGRYAEEPSTDHLAGYFHLDDADRELVMAKRWDHMRANSNPDKLAGDIAAFRKTVLRFASNELLGKLPLKSCAV